MRLDRTTHATARYIPSHCIGIACRRTILHRGFATIQDDILLRLLFTVGFVNVQLSGI